MRSKNKNDHSLDKFGLLEYKNYQSSCFPFCYFEVLKIDFVDLISIFNIINLQIWFIDISETEPNTEQTAQQGSAEHLRNFTDSSTRMKSYFLGLNITIL